ncbi:FecR domain-containing protein [Chloroflexota bacterium]
MKQGDFKIILEQCIEKLRQGGSVEECLLVYPEYREKLEPLLSMVLRLSSIEEIKPSQEFITDSKVRLLNRIRRISAESQTAQQKQRSLIRTLPNLVSDFFQYPVSLKRHILPVAVALVLIMLVSIGQLFYFRPSITMAAPCTLNVFTGNVEVQVPGTDEWQYGTNQMILEMGTVIKTYESSHAILTFFTGSTSIKLEPATEVVIQQLDNGDETDTIVLLQNTGKTWSFVGSSDSAEINYQVKTPAATASAMGTLFTVEVDDEGSTIVATTEGTVSVTTQNDEVLLSNSQKVRVKPGEALPAPSPISPPVTEISISIDNGGGASITDPNSSSTGTLESGFSYNQITGSQSIVAPDGPRIITIPEPVNGEYILLLSCEAPGKTGFNILITSDNKEIFRYDGSFLTGNQKLWLVHLDLFVENGIVLDAAVNEVEALVSRSIDDIVTVSPHIGEQEKEKGKSKPEKEKEYPDKNDKQEKDKDSDEYYVDIEGEDNRGQGKKDKNEEDNKGQDQKDKNEEDNKGQGQKDKDEEDKGNQSQDKSDDKENKDSPADKDNNGQGKKDDDSKGKESGNKNKDK